MGLTGIPIFNVNNNCATGSSALHMANQVVAGGLSDCVLAVGFEKMQRGSLGSTVSYNFMKLCVNHSLIRGVLIQSCSAGAKNFTNYVFCHPQFNGVIQNIENHCAILIPVCLCRLLSK